MYLSKSINIPILEVFLLGILGSTAPCQITTNLGAIGYMAKEGSVRKDLIKNMTLYSIGKIAIFLLYGLLITVFHIKLQNVSIPLFSVVRKFMGILVILIGLCIIGVINLKGSIGSNVIKNQKNSS
ncbi:urease accessory protein UreH domain-containing protein [Anaeromicropila herbilytica]|nr:sulfite exporter TauE/SafE family protein [Anaeromicropila herbilytica]